MILSVLAASGRAGIAGTLVGMFVIRGLRVGFCECRRAYFPKRSYARSLYDPENKGVRQEHVNFDTLGTWDNRIELPVLMRESILRGKPIPHIAVGNVGVATHVGRRTCNEDRAHVCELAPGFLYAAVFDGHGGTECAEYDAEGASSGTTATVCLLHNSVELIVSHVGDSRALLCRNGEPMALNTDHGPTVKSEKERIEKSGGNIVCNSVGQSLVNGRLAMTRSLGDLELKRYGVIALPDIRSLQVKHGNDAFLILTTDGVNGVMSNQEICDTVKRGQNPQEAAGFVVDQALQYASDDNTTAILVPFGSWGKFSSSAAGNYSFGRNVIHSLRYM